MTMIDRVQSWTPDTDTQKPDRTDYCAVKAWLNRYREAEKRYYLLSDRLAEAQEATRRKVDLANLIEATCDILVKAKVLADDNSQIVAAHDGSRVDYDKKNPRAEIWIEEMEDKT